MEKLLIACDEDGFSVSEATETLASAALEGGPARTRLDVLDAPRIVGLKWTCSRNKYQNLVAFFGDNLGRNREPFLMDLLASHSTLEEYECRLLPDTLQQSTLTGFRYVVSAQFEIVPTFDEYIGQTCVGGVQLTNGWPDVADTPEPPGTDVPIYLDTFTGSGLVQDHTPDVVPAGMTGAYTVLDTPATLSGGKVSLPVVAGSINFIVLDGWPVFAPVEGRSYFQINVSQAVAGNIIFVAELDFGVDAADFIQIIIERSDGVPHIRAALNSDFLIDEQFVEFNNLTIRVEFESGSLQLFINNVAFGSAAYTCGQILGDGASVPYIVMQLTDIPATAPVGQAMLVDLIEFGTIVI